jgi:hypothetical protein
MPKVFKDGWEYFYSDTLKQEIALNKKSGSVYCEDRVWYDSNELRIMDTAGQEITLGVHLVKSLFRGKIVEFKEIQNHG